MLKITDELIEYVLNAITLVETGNNKKKWYRLYRASIGKSGYSIGKIQFDLKHNQTGRNMVIACGVDYRMVQALSDDGAPPLYKEIFVDLINEITDTQASHMIIDNECKKYIKNSLIRLNKLDGFEMPNDWDLATYLIDYHIQFHISKNGAMHKFLSGLESTPTKETIIEYRRNMSWYKKEAGRLDTERRLKELDSYVIFTKK